MASEPLADALHNADVAAPAVRPGPAPTVRPRRTNSMLGSAIRAGDTGAPALATSRASFHANSPRSRKSAPGGPPAVSGPAANAYGSGRRSSKRRRARGLMSRLRQIMVKHTYFLPAAILAAILTGYAVNPTDSNPLHHFIFLSYPLPRQDLSEPVRYGKGPWDIALVIFYTVVLSFTREFVMQEILRPVARRSGLSQIKQARYMEQAYTAIYFGILGPAGLYVMSRTPVWYFNTYGMYDGFPHRTHEGVVKFYYLFEAAYWAQQAIVLILGLEKPRKDFKELVGHHIVSLSLIALSYRFHFTHMGIAVYLTHDISDFFLASSKIMNYLDYPWVGGYFGVFVFIWVYLRHYINLRIIWSLFTEFRTVGPFELDWETEQYKCWISQYITAALLLSLQALNLFWLFFILRIAYRYVFLDIAEDDREEEDEEDDSSQQEKSSSDGDAAVQDKTSWDEKGSNGRVAEDKPAENGFVKS